MTGDSTSAMIGTVYNVGIIYNNVVMNVINGVEEKWIAKKESNIEIINQNSSRETCRGRITSYWYDTVLYMYQLFAFI